jgi:hypothetical protein
MTTNTSWKAIFRSKTSLKIIDLPWWEYLGFIRKPKRILTQQLLDRISAIKVKGEWNDMDRQLMVRQKEIEELAREYGIPT